MVRFRFVVAAAITAASAPVLAQPWVFTPQAASGDRVGVEMLGGSRDAGAFGRHGAELRASWQHEASAGWTLEAGTGVLRDPTSDGVESSYAGEARYAWADSGVSTGFGARVDYENVLIPSLRLGWTQVDAAYPFAVSLVSEFPRASGRDAADLLFTAGQRLPCSASFECALEIAGEDLEGFFNPEEAEGGARLILGPSLGWQTGTGRTLRLFAGWIHAATSNIPTRAGYASEPRDGAMLRLALNFGE